MDALLGALNPSSGTSLLDLGCGTGAFLSRAQAAGFEPICGIDASPKMIALSRTNAPKADVRVGAFEALPWPDATFDHVTSIEALYYCLAPRVALEEVARVLKPSGRFDLIIDYYTESEGTQSWPEGLGFEISRLAIAEWIDLAESVGLHHCQSERILHPNPDRMLSQWQASVWYPTQESYQNYLANGAFWLTAFH
jgi:ubiquinone/menaquinone biosynthesis C-methylase UbiE